MLKKSDVQIGESFIDRDSLLQHVVCGFGANYGGTPAVFTYDSRGRLSTIPEVDFMRRMFRTEAAKAYDIWHHRRTGEKVKIIEVGVDRTTLTEYVKTISVSDYSIFPVADFLRDFRAGPAGGPAKPIAERICS